MAQAVLESSGKSIADIEAAPKTATHYLLSEKFDNKVKLHLDFLLLENPYETYTPLQETDYEGDVEETAYKRIMRTGVIRASYEDYPPTFMANTENQTYSGIFYELLERIAREKSLSITFTEETGYGVITDGLHKQRFDLFAATVWPTPERRDAAEFSKPVYFSNVYAWTTDGKGIADRVDFRLAVKENDISHSIAKADFPNAGLVYVPQLSDPSMLLQFVAEDKADATFAEPCLVEEFGRTSSGLPTLVRGASIIRQYANTFMMRQGERELKEMFDEAIQKYADEGFIAHLIKKYTGRTDTFDLPRASVALK